ncbi:hypothetical protein A4A49_41449 [Nicotiana attenuata]|uniref:NAC domain-containing protein n=1 Tax=Nicotiana attenuata TaxID=49451 RepID=A0A1J6JRJ5_NICAT|nr:hypothetical protein A4A49_41449 [Nicotiana attenuata]
MEYSQAKCFSRPMVHRFHPTDREVLKYLIGFVRDEPLHSQNELMQVADLYADKEPWQIFEAYDQGNNNKNTRYFITPQKRKRNLRGKEFQELSGRALGSLKAKAEREIKNKGFVICKIKKKGKPGDKKKGNNIDEVVNDENMRDIEEFINTVLQEDVQVEDNGIRSNGIAKLDDQENNIIQYVEGDQVRDHVLGLLDSPEDIVDVNDHEEYVEDCVDEGDEVQVHLLKEFIDSVLQSEDVQAEDNGMMSSNDQENMEYQVEDNQHATFWASAEDVDLDTINFF